MFLMFGLFESKEVKKVKSHLRYLASLAKIDGHVDEAEMNLLYQVADKNGIKPNVVRSIVSNPRSVEIEIPDNNAERFYQLFDIVQLMLADGIIHDSELDYCVEMAKKLGFRKAIVGVLVNKIARGVRDGVDREDIKKESEAFMIFESEVKPEIMDESEKEIESEPGDESESESEDENVSLNEGEQESKGEEKSEGEGEDEGKSEK